jgi:hypothetical protein
MLGRHVYRVHSAGDGWIVTKDGEEHSRGEFTAREQAIAAAVRAAEADEPAKVMIENGDGTIANEWLFGADSAEELKT